MGYTTYFSGEWDLNKKLDDVTHKLLDKLNEEDTRQVDNSTQHLLKEGEAFPGYWCGWVPDEDGETILWDGGEKFYDYEEWIQWIITKVLDPRGYVLNGKVYWSGEEDDDVGIIKIENNIVLATPGSVYYNTDVEEDIFTEVKSCDPGVQASLLKLIKYYKETNLQEVIDDYLKK